MGAGVPTNRGPWMASPRFGRALPRPHIFRGRDDLPRRCPTERISHCSFDSRLPVFFRAFGERAMALRHHCAWKLWPRFFGECAGRRGAIRMRFECGMAARGACTSSLRMHTGGHHLQIWRGLTGGSDLSGTARAHNLPGVAPFGSPTVCCRAIHGEDAGRGLTCRRTCGWCAGPVLLHSTTPAHR